MAIQVRRAQTKQDGHADGSRGHFIMGVRLILGPLLIFGSLHSAGGVRALFIAMSILVLGADVVNLVSLRNFYLFYLVTIFALGPATLGDHHADFVADMAIFGLAFVVGYGLPRLAQEELESRPTGPDGPTDKVLLVPVAAYVGFLAFQAFKFGLRTVYAGGAAAQQIDASAHGDSLVVIVPISLKAIGFGASVAYITSALRRGDRIRYPRLVLVLVGLPALAFQRSAAFVGALMIVGILALDRRFISRSSVKADIGAPTRIPRRAYAVVALMLALGVGLQVGVARETKLRSARGLPADGVLDSQFRQEFTPLRTYTDAHQAVEAEGILGGRTVIPPIVTQFVPRAVWDSKPPTSAEYLMRKFHSSEFAAGYSVPPTLFGDLFLNFGWVGSGIALVLLGIGVATLDRAYVKAELSRVPAFLIAYAAAYSTLRDGLPTGLASAALSAGIYQVFKTSRW